MFGFHFSFAFNGFKPGFTKDILLIALVVFGFMLQRSFAQKTDETGQKVFTHHMTPEEELKKGEIGKNFIATPPPTGPVYNVAEFNRMQAVLVRYPFGISYAIIAEMSQDLDVITIVANTSQQTTVTNNYIANGVNMANCSFLIAPSDSYWTRDYGPWFVFDGNDEPGIVDFPYNRPDRTYDDEIPVEVADYLGINLFGMNVIHTGGNYMTDGMGISSSSELVWDENPTLTQTQISQYFEDYLGINTYHVVPDPNNTYIDHIDCWGKFLDVDKVLIREVPPSHAQYDEIEATAAYYASQISSYGTPYQVFRVYTPQDQPYTNSIILNEKVLVPIMSSQWDDEALAVYQQAMPGYGVFGFTGSWESTDALHCRAKGIADLGMLRIKHIPLQGNQPLQPDYPIQAEIKAYSGSAIYPDSVFIIYSVNHCGWDTIPMIHISGNNYAANIPGQIDNSVIDYYLFAADQSGRNETHPLIGKPDPHQFVIGNPADPNIIVNPFSLEITLTAGGYASNFLTIQNTGDVCLNYDGSISYNAKSKTLIQVNPLNGNYNTGSTSSTAKTEISKVKGYPPNEAGWMKFDVSSIPDGATINSVEFHGYVNASNWPWWNITPVSNDPVTTAASTLSTDIKAEASSGYYLHREESGTLTAGYVVHPLAGNVLTNLQSALAQDWFAIGIVDTDASTYYIGFDGWNETNKPYLIIDYTMPIPPFTWLTLDGTTTTNGTLAGQDSQTVQVGFDASGLEEGIYTANIEISSNDPDIPIVTIPVTLNVVSHIYIDLKVFLEGPFGGTAMNTSLTGLIPLNQPYNASPWNYSGSEQVTEIPIDVVDWVLVEYRDAASAISATAATAISRQAAFILNDGSVVDLDGISYLQPSISVSQELFVVIYHRNHLAVMSNEPLVMTGGIYPYNFSDGETKAYGGLDGHKLLASGVWAMRSGNCNGDNETDITDKNIWSSEVGQDGYTGSDLNLDLQINNIDKNDFWLPNSVMGSQVPE
jgi:agmatine/peptidylarginine deiminase